MFDIVLVKMVGGGYTYIIKEYKEPQYEKENYKKGIYINRVISCDYPNRGIDGNCVTCCQKSNVWKWRKEISNVRKIAYEASKLYVQNYRGEITNASSDCFNVPYETLLNEGLIEEEDINCTGNIIIDNTSGDGNEYTAYLTCKDKNGKIVHEAEGGLPLYCTGFSGNFVVNYELYEDTTHTQSYQEGDWARYVYGTYSSSNPYNIEIDRYEYTKDLLNWVELNPNNQEYENYNGNIYVRAIDQANNVSNMNNHIVRADSKGAQLQFNE